MTNDIDNDIDKIGEKHDKEASDIDKSNFDNDKKEVDIDKTKNDIDKNHDKGIDYAKRGYVDLEEAPVIRKVSSRTLRRDIDKFLKELGLTWKAEPEELSKKTKKIIKKPVRGLLNEINFKWDISNLWLDELDRRYRRERVVNVKQQPDYDKPKVDIDKPKSDYDKPKEKGWAADIGQKIKTALKWQGLRHEGDVRVYKKEIEIKEKIITEQKKELKKKEEKIVYLTGMGGRAEGKAELLLEENEKLRGQLRLSPGLRDTTAGEGSFRRSKETEEEEIKKEENNE